MRTLGDILLENAKKVVELMQFEETEICPVCGAKLQPEERFCCDRFKEAIEDYELKKAKYPSGIEFSFCVIEGIESRIYYCPWCGKEL